MSTNKTAIHRVVIVCLIGLGAAGCGRQCLQEKGKGYQYTRIADGGQKNFNWPDGKRAAVSLTFDDARPSEIDNGLEILTVTVSRPRFMLYRPLWKKGWPAGKRQSLTAMKSATTR